MSLSCVPSTFTLIFLNFLLRWLWMGWKFTTCNCVYKHKHFLYSYKIEINSKCEIIQILILNLNCLEISEIVSKRSKHYESSFLNNLKLYIYIYIYLQGLFSVALFLYNPINNSHSHWIAGVLANLKHKSSQFTHTKNGVHWQTITHSMCWGVLQ